MPVKHKKVDWTSDDDLKAAIMAAMGFSTQFICEQTGLSPCQVTYRLHKGRIYRRDYRNGGSDMAQRVMERAMPGRARDIRDTLNLKPKEK